MARSQLDDVSIGLWALAADIRVTHLPSFLDARTATECDNQFVSFAEVKEEGMRHFHANLKAGRPVCSGYDQEKFRHGHVYAYAKTLGGQDLAD